MGDWLINANKKTLVGLLNRLIHEAVLHGGDSGGAYETNREGLLSAMRYIRTWLGLNKYIIVESEAGFAYALPVEEEVKSDG